MYVRKRIGRRRSFIQKHRILMLFLLGTAACLFAFVFTQHLRRSSNQVVFDPPAYIPVPEADRPIQPAKNERFVYPYSVIPGGVLSREELANNVGSDPVVADHYGRFAVGQAKIVKSEETQFVHVAYRLREKVYWTKKKLKIPQGETLITDGRESARTRCGNRVSAVPLEPVSEEEPAIETFDMPVLARLEVPQFDALPPSSLDVGDFPVLEPYIPVQKPKILPYYYRPLFVVKPTPAAVPEPATLSLLAIGLAAFLTFRFTRKK